MIDDPIDQARQGMCAMEQEEGPMLVQCTNYEKYQKGLRGRGKVQIH